MKENAPMCETCGCNVTHANEHLVAAGGKLERTKTGNESVEVLRHLLHANDHEAAHNRRHFDAHRVLAVNLMSSPGAGKTLLLERTIERLGDEKRIAVIEGDLDTENDARRIRDKGVPAIQITTGTACHLDAHMVHAALHDLALDELDIVFIENVGNLVCPASFDLGQHLNVTLLSSPEGDDKPAKYPVMFRAADLMLITKFDLIDVLGDFEPARAEAHLRHLANPAPVIELSARSGYGMDAWADWLTAALASVRMRVADGGRARPAIQPQGAARHATLPRSG
jgi:hydrogenase nickel incorporation protein HypB